MKMKTVIAEEMSGRKYVQIFASLSANLGQMGVGHCVPLSSFLLPQLVPGEGDLVLSEEEGSWFGENAPVMLVLYYYFSICVRGGVPDLVTGGRVSV